MTCHCSSPAAWASLNMARLKKAAPHASAALISAPINTPPKSMKSQPLYEIHLLDRAPSVHWRSALPVNVPQNVRETLEEPIYTLAAWPMRPCCELLHSGNVCGSKHVVQWHWNQGCDTQTWKSVLSFMCILFTQQLSCIVEDRSKRKWRIILYVCGFALDFFSPGFGLEEAHSECLHLSGRYKRPPVRSRVLGFLQKPACF